MNVPSRKSLQLVWLGRFMIRGVRNLEYTVYVDATYLVVDGDLSKCLV